MLVDKSEEKIKIGEITWGRDLKNVKRLYSKFIWSQCPDCKKERWVEIKSVKEQTGHTLCVICNGKKNGKINKKNFGRG
jgi:hypothetical protein